ncbi:MAG: hypothetical protein ACRENM_01135 [Candidatus Dormibacteraceae bacterium]
MKKWIALLILLGVVYVVWNRQRVFVRDPLASVVRAGTTAGGEQVYINFKNDVLLENDNPPMQVLLVQHGQPIGVPTKLHCLHWAACLTDADVATTLPLGGTVESMSGKAVRFQYGDAQEWVVSLH